jgi:hypothetical protein
MVATISPSPMCEDRLLVPRLMIISVYFCRYRINPDKSRLKSFRDLNFSEKLQFSISMLDLLSQPKPGDLRLAVQRDGAKNSIPLHRKSK